MKQLQKRALWERIFLLLYAEIQLKISRIRRIKGPLSGLAKITFKTRKKDENSLARKQFVDPTKVNVDACSNKFPICSLRLLATPKKIKIKKKYRNGAHLKLRLAYGRRSKNTQIHCIGVYCLYEWFLCVEQQELMNIHDE